MVALGRGAAATDDNSKLVRIVWALPQSELKSLSLLLPEIPIRYWHSVRIPAPLNRSRELVMKENATATFLRSLRN